LYENSNNFSYSSFSKYEFNFSKFDLEQFKKRIIKKKHFRCNLFIVITIILLNLGKARDIITIKAEIVSRGMQILFMKGEANNQRGNIRYVILTPLGKRKLESAIPYWKIYKLKLSNRRNMLYQNNYFILTMVVYNNYF